ncbi:serine carboxypeptidase-domain-containing protein [Mycena vulgaris]|nr:serine carboxypeptidase-domain-containing protein [Mycena vulgaris]
MNIIFLDEPVNVGYSFSANNMAPAQNTPAAAQDVYAVLQLFVRRFEEYATLPFHLAGESYGGDSLSRVPEVAVDNERLTGHYVPHIASAVYHKNKDHSCAVNWPPEDQPRVNHDGKRAHRPSDPDALRG